MKPILFLSDSLEAIRDFPSDVRREVGHQLDRVQRGLMPDDWKPLTTLGAGVGEIRLRNATGAFRVIYVAESDKAVCVLHAFQKKTQRTTRADFDLARKRLRDYRRPA
ncbi:MAG: type II toxin-antitoxin system RelE/ParE family toxin [Gammaproteobacteria bacterium]